MSLPPLHDWESLVLMKVPSFKRTDPRLGQPEPTRHLAVLWQAGRDFEPVHARHWQGARRPRKFIRFARLAGDFPSAP